MGSVKDSAPDATRAAGLARQSWPSRACPRPMSGIAPAMLLRSPEAHARPDPKASSLIPVPPGVGPRGRQPKLFDRLREALRSRHYSSRTEQTYRHWVKRFIDQGARPSSHRRIPCSAHTLPFSCQAAKHAKAGGVFSRKSGSSVGTFWYGPIKGEIISCLPLRPSRSLRERSGFRRPSEMPLRRRA
jgi:hypothetical protein